MTEPRYVPAAGRAIFTGLYDPILALTMRERSWRHALLDTVSAGLPEAGTAVDVGTGTGTFAIALAALRPDASVIGVDGDETVLARARRKPGSEPVDWREGLAGELPVETRAADAVVMSLVLHHLAPEAKRSALEDVRRLLRPGARLHVADWGKPRGVLPSAGFLALRFLDGFEGTRDHAAGEIPSMIREAGFEEPLVWKRVPTAWGTLELMDADRAWGM